MKNQMTDLQRVVCIDEDCLDREWLDHPGLVYRCGEKHADAKHALNMAENRLKLTEAKLLIAIRSAPSTYDLPDKPPVDLIKAAVLMHLDYRKANKKVMEATREVLHFGVVMSALEHRRRALEATVDLLKMRYFSSPSSDDPEQKERVEDERVKTTRTSMSKRKK